jgi:hypothetical protein
MSFVCKFVVFLVAKFKVITWARCVYEIKDMCMA